LFTKGTKRKYFHNLHNYHFT